MTHTNISPRSAARPSRRLARLAAGAGIIAVGQAGQAGAATLQVGPNAPYKMPSEAAAAAHDGDHVVIAAGTYFDCAVWRANDLTIEGAAPDASIITDKTCLGKGIFVTQGNNITIRNLTLTRARVPDFNGAGLRAEGGNLTIDHVSFVNNQDGLLGDASPGHAIIIRDSDFIRNGTCEGGGGCAHGIYVGEMALLRIERSRFRETRQGHHIKSKTQRTEVIDCTIEDGPAGTASYTVDLPSGGSVVLRGNHIQKGAKSENHRGGLMIGEDGVSQPTAEITVEHNTFLVQGDYNAYLVNNMTATEAQLIGNTLQGNAKALRGDGTVR